MLYALMIGQDCFFICPCLAPLFRPPVYGLFYRCILLLPYIPDAPEVATWQARADRVTIVRDDWGIPHVYGNTDADVVFGLMYAQAEDDFNRVETNFINAQGRLAEAEGESEIYRDLRMKLFMEPGELRAQYAQAEPWLKALMDAWADGLNFYLHTHPEVTPRVITRFEPWMALSFSEGSIGGDIESINLGALEALYGAPTPGAPRHGSRRNRRRGRPSRPGQTGLRSPGRTRRRGRPSS